MHKYLILSSSLCLSAVQPSLAGQVSVVNPSAGSSMLPTTSITSTPTVTTTSTAPVSTSSVAPSVEPISVPPATVEVLPPAPTVTADSVTSGIAETGIAPAPTQELVTSVPTAASPVQSPSIVQQVLSSFGASVQPASPSAAPPSSGGASSGGDVASAGASTSAPTTVSQFTPQISAAVQSVNIATFTPAQVSTLISTIDVQLAQPGLAPAARQVLVTERARLAGIAQQ